MENERRVSGMKTLHGEAREKKTERWVERVNRVSQEELQGIYVVVEICSIFLLEIQISKTT
jgi:hypothetical protein